MDDLVESTNSEMMSAIREIAEGSCARAKGARAIIWTLAVAKKPDFQKIENGWFIELCPAYFRELKGVTHWSARKAWPAMSRVTNWSEMKFEEARARGAKIRFVPKARRGRLLRLSSDARDAIESVQQILESENAAYRKSSDANLSTMTSTSEFCLALPREIPVGHTLAVSCPRTEQHKNGDRNPSLVIWRNELDCGGAKCMVCQRNGKPRTWRVEFTHPTLATFYSPRAALNAQAKASGERSKPISRNNRDTRRQRNARRGALMRRSRAFQSDQALGGHAHNPQRSQTLLAASLMTFRDADSTRTSRQITGRLDGDLLGVLESSEKSSSGSTAREKAEYIWSISLDLEEAHEQLPTKMISVSYMTSLSARNRGVRWVPCSQRWVLFDFDEIRFSSEGVSAAMAKSIVRIVRRDKQLSGRCAIVQTSDQGLHVWAELKVPRKRPKIWHRKPEVVDWYEALGHRILRAIHKYGAEDGTLDMSSCAAGRFARLPSWRVTKSGTLFRSKLVLIERQPVKSRLTCP